jgi:predicted ribosomally synthesized peptide with SipW-like signal peptide
MRNPARWGARSIGKKAVLSAGLLALLAGVVGMGAFALFTDTQSVSQADTTGTVTLADISVNAANNRLSVGASNLAAGDTIQRTVNVKNTGTITLSTITLTTSATTSSVLDTDATNGLQMVIDKCSQAWTETGGPPYTYTCGGSTNSVVASTPVLVTNQSLANVSLTGGADNFLRVTLSLASSAGTPLEGKSSTIQYSFTATQRAGQAQ